MADNYLVFNAAEAIHYGDAVKGTYSFQVVIPTVPTAGDVRRFGLYSLNRDSGIYFEVTGTTFQAVLADDDNDKEVTESITFEDEWVGVPIICEIMWEAGLVHFSVNGVRKCTLSFEEDKLATSSTPMSLYVRNDNSDDMLVGFIEARDIYQYA